MTMPSSGIVSPGQAAMVRSGTAFPGCEAHLMSQVQRLDFEVAPQNSWCLLPGEFMERQRFCARGGSILDGRIMIHSP